MSWRNNLSKSLNELRIHYSQNAASSNGIRQFITKEYPELKKVNPTLPILIREYSNVEPRITARYDYGIEKSFTLINSDEHDIVNKINELIEYSKSLPKVTNKNTQRQLVQ